MAATQELLIGEGAGNGVKNYIEDVFSTYLYTGNATARSIQNGIDLAGKGGLTWIKDRSAGIYYHYLYDTTSGATKYLNSNTTNAQGTAATSLTSFNSDGFSLGIDSGNSVNVNNVTFASWTFRKQPKFFDIVTYTGDDNPGRTISHNLGSKPGCMLIKSTTNTAGWLVYHQSLGATKFLQLHVTTAAVTAITPWNNTEPTTTQFTVGNSGAVNAAGQTYVAYLFAHDAGGFGLTGTDNVISCGSYTTDGSGNATVSLGYEPQFGIFKCSSAVEDWVMKDSMRGWVTQASGNKYLLANSSAAEAGSDGYLINATGFSVIGATPSATYIYIAIRRGPMKVPTDATKVFSAQTYSGSGSTRVLDATIVPDIYIGNTRTPSGGPVGVFVDRLRGNSKYIRTYDTTAEAGTPPSRDFSNQTGFTLDSTSDNVSGRTYATWFMKRAPSFFDEVCYTGTGTSSRAISHNLGVAPEMIILKGRTFTAGAAISNWIVWTKDIATDSMLLMNDAGGLIQYFFNWQTSSTTFNSNYDGTNLSGNTIVGYLFATCPGVSKVGSYTGNGSSQTINCGFAAGARFVLIKRKDSTGDWYVWDTARGIVAGNDGHLSLNTTAAEVTTDDTIDPDSTGFIVNQLAATNVNVNAATYIYLAIA